MLLLIRFFYVFWKSKKRDFLRFLLCFTRFLELCVMLNISAEFHKDRTREITSVTNQPTNTLDHSTSLRRGGKYQTWGPGIQLTLEDEWWRKHSPGVVSARRLRRCCFALPLATAIKNAAISRQMATPTVVPMNGFAAVQTYTRLSTHSTRNFITTRAA